MISTRNLSELPDVNGLLRLMKSLAVLDAILCRDWQYRYYSFNSKWSDYETMGSMRDGCGSAFFALFNADGCFLKGFVPRVEMVPVPEGDSFRLWPGLIDTVPAEFQSCLVEPAFSMESTTFCIWRGYRDSQWQRGAIAFPVGEDPDGSQELLSILDGRPDSYGAWAVDYYELSEISLDAVRHVYDHSELTGEIVYELRSGLIGDNEPVSLTDLEDDVAEIGYPDRKTVLKK